MTAGEAHGRLRSVLEREGLDLLLITKMENVRYLTGFTGSFGVVLIDKEKALFITDPRYTEQARKECEGWQVKELRNERLSQWIARNYTPKVVGVEEWLQVGSLERMKKNLPDTNFKVVFKAVESLREVKTEGEIENIRRALRIAEEAFKEVLNLVKPGITEKEIALELEMAMRRRGAEGVSFPIIVASGYRSSLPHGTASEKKIENGDLIVFDFGCTFKGYCSDITRMVKVGKLTPEEKRVIETVRRAHEAAVEAIDRGERDCRKVHHAAQRVIEEAGYTGLFGHGLGHGVGLEIHEGPTLSPLSEDRLRAGNVLTVEPGIYIPGRFGVRLENIYLLEEDGCQCLNSLPLDPIEL